MIEKDYHHLSYLMKACGRVSHNLYCDTKEGSVHFLEPESEGVALPLPPAARAT